MKTMFALGACIALLVLEPPVATAASSSPLYEKFEVLGALDCEIDGDIRLYVDSERTLQCDYEPRDVPDGLKRYRGSVREIQAGLSVGDGDFACWTVLRLGKEEHADTEKKSIAGTYASASSATIDEHQLKAATLVASGASRLALEPRCVAPRAGENIADKIVRIDLVN